jgi:uncharacterized protein YpuA (DUF1002 family)
MPKRQTVARWDAMKKETPVASCAHLVVVVVVVAAAVVAVGIGIAATGGGSVVVTSSCWQVQQNGDFEEVHSIPSCRSWKTSRGH